MTPHRVRILARKFGLRERLPEACEAEADSLSVDLGGLEDLSHLPFVTIDEPHSKDLDQALYVESREPGWVAWYAIADAAFFVHPDSALFAEALRRGATYYLPGLMVPMLPRRLCEDLVSINPQVERRALVFRMEVAADGTATATRVCRAHVRSRAKLHYDGVQAFLDGRSESGCAEAEDSLRSLVDFGEARLAHAEGRDVVHFHRRELELCVGGQHLHVFAREDPRNDVERYNEQLSLLANIEGARLLATAHDAWVQPVFRTHDPPAPERLMTLRRQLGIITAARPDLAWDRGESLAAYIRRLPDEPMSQVISRQVMRAGGRSGFSAEPGVHHGVGADVYARFTAPMREVVGVFVHKEMWELLAGGGRVDPEVQAAVIRAASRAKSLQRRLDGACECIALDRLFETRSHFEAIVMGLGKGRLHLQLLDPPLDVKLYLRDLPGARAAGIRLRRDGEEICRLGDVVTVCVQGLDERRNRWVLGL